MNAYVQSLLGILLSAILTENYILVKFYGICPFMGVSKKMDTALGMGMAVTFVMALASAACWAVNTFLLIPFELQYMQTVAFILVIASLVQVVEHTDCAANLAHRQNGAAQFYRHIACGILYCVACFVGGNTDG